MSAVDISTERARNLARDLETLPFPAERGCILRNGAAFMLRALAAERDGLLAERDMSDAAVETAMAQRDAALAEVERMREAGRALAAAASAPWGDYVIPPDHPVWEALHVWDDALARKEREG